MSAPDERTAQLLGVLQKALGHELPNHLLAVQGLARILEMEEGERLGPDSKDYLGRLAGAAKRADELVRALADMIRLSRMTPSAVPVSLPEVIRHVAAELKHLYPGPVIEYHFPEAEVFLVVPGPVLRQVVLQLLRNALQAASSQRDLRVEVGIRETATHVEFWIADNGCGLSAQRQQRLFEPFAGRAAGAAGTGLGLILVHHLVESWDGALNVASTPDQGSTFTVSFLREALNEE